MSEAIDKSDEISLDLLHILLASVKKENLVIELKVGCSSIFILPPSDFINIFPLFPFSMFQCLSPFSFKLGERVLENCASKLKPYLQDVASSMGISFGDYANIVASICQGATQRENMVVFLS